MSYVSSRQDWQWIVAAGAAFALTAIGCYDTPPLGQVSGCVTLDGAPIAEATIMFVPLKGGRPSTCVTGLDGRYELRFDGIHQGAMVGAHEVMISTAYPEITAFDEFDEPVVLSPERPERLPRRYNTRTELSAEVRTGRNSFDFNLRSDPPDASEQGAGFNPQD